MNIIATLGLTLMSFAIGFLAQRSRMCFIAGFRDFILVRDKELLYGFISFLATIWLLTSILYGTGLIDDGIPETAVDEIANTISSEESEEKSNRLIAETESAEHTKKQLSYESKILLTGGDFPITSFFWVSITGGFLIGLVSVWAGGCTLRQHVLVAQGSGDALYYLLGFFSMVIIYELFLRGIISELF